jgi:hypothetical protein
LKFLIISDRIKYLAISFVNEFSDRFTMYFINKVTFFCVLILGYGQIEASQGTSSFSVNESPLLKIRKIVHEEHKATPALENLLKEVKRLEWSAGKSRIQGTKLASEWLITSVVNSKDKDSRFKPNPLANPKNNNERSALDTFESVKASSSSQKNKRKIIIADEIARYGGDEVLNGVLVVDYTHCQTPCIKKDGLGNVEGVLGGHNYEEYEEGLLEGIYFESPKHKALGVYVDRSVPKTVKRNFDVAYIQSILPKFQPIAQQNELEICQSLDGFFGRFADKKLPIIVPSIFPLIVIENQPAGSVDDVKLGELGSINANNKKTFNQDVHCTREEFDTMISQGTVLPSHRDYHSNIVDISEQIKNHRDIQACIASAGLKTNKFFPVYALVKKP